MVVERQPVPTRRMPPREERIGEGATFDAWRLFLQSHAVLLGGLDAALRREAGMPISWYDVLFHVDETPQGRISLHDLEGCVYVSQSTVSRIAARLERAGLVERAVSAEDRRVVEITLTAAGLARLERAFDVAADYVRQNFAAVLGPEDGAHLRDLLRKLTAAPPS
jgi:DNA-binding MarR family transcriptional regulator